MTDVNLQPGTLAAVAVALSVKNAKPVAERDYFPCAFCFKRFDTKDERQLHEMARCEAADEMPPKREPRPMKALIDGKLTQDELRRRLALGGLELYPDAAGNTVIRTVESGDQHRQQVQDERRRSYLERNPGMERYV